MERKLVKHGPSTFMVSLPKKWIDTHGFQKGDSIQYEERPDSIVFYAQSYRRESKSIEVDVSGLDRTTILFMLRGLYRKGYAEITLHFDKPTAHHFRKDEDVRVSSIVLNEVQKLIGVEISSYGRSSVVIKQLAEPTQDEFVSSFRRVFLQMRMLLQDLAEAMEAGDKLSIEATEEKHDSLTKIISFCLRILHQERRWENAPYLTATLMEIELLTDLLMYFARYLLDQEISPSKSAVGVVRSLAKLQQLLEQMYFSWDNELAAEFNKERENLKEQLEGVSDREKPYLYHLTLPSVSIQRSVLQARLNMTDDLLS